MGGEERHREQNPEAENGNEDQKRRKWRRREITAEWRQHRQRAEAADGKRGTENRWQVGMRRRGGMMILSTDMQMPVGIRFPPVPMRVAVDSASNHAPHACGPKHDQQQPAKDLPAVLDDHRKRPAERDESTGAYREQQRVADCEANGYAERARPLNGRCITGAANGQRRNRHEVIGAKTMEKAESEG